MEASLPLSSSALVRLHLPHCSVPAQPSGNKVPSSEERCSAHFVEKLVQQAGAKRWDN